MEKGKKDISKSYRSITSIIIHFVDTHKLLLSGVKNHYLQKVTLYLKSSNMGQMSKELEQIAATTRPFADLIFGIQANGN